MSIFDEYEAAFANEQLVHYLGESGGIRYVPPAAAAGNPSAVLQDAIIGDVRTDEVDEIDGDSLVRRKRLVRDIRVPTSGIGVNDNNPVSNVQHDFNGTIVIVADGTNWKVVSIANDGPNMRMLTCQRMPRRYLQRAGLQPDAT